MIRRLGRFSLLFAVAWLSCQAAAPTALAQADFGSLTGQILDPSGAAIPGAAVSITASSGQSLKTKTNKEGFYEFKALAPGKYVVKVTSRGFAVFTSEDLEIIAGQTQKLDISMSIQTEEQKVEVTDSNTKVDVNPENNAGMIVLKGKDLEALSDDPDELQSDLQALAGPSAGPNGGQIYIDGFTGGTLPAKDSIREIRINQNPFSPEFDKLGYGRIEILTKPGTDKFRGNVNANFGDDIFNSRNPFAAQKAPFLLREFGGTVSGPLSKKASFFLDVFDRDIHNGNIINAVTLDPNSFGVTPFNTVFEAPQNRLRVSPRVD